jgi:tetratricopeptide (TPR) repeat protein
MPYGIRSRLMNEEVSQLLKTGEYQAALELLLAQYSTNPDNPVVINDLGIVCFTAGYYSDATKWFNTLSINLENAHTEPTKNGITTIVYQNLAQSALLSGHLEIALSALIKLQSIDPSNVLVQSNLDKLALEKLKTSVLEAEMATKSFITYHIRPTQSSSYGLISDYLPKEKIAIVIQGPLLTFENFTLETVKLYKRIFPFCKLIVSTWADEDSVLIDMIRVVGAEIVLNEKPGLAGFMNINMQIRSALNGIKQAQQTDSIYVLKTRTDYRIYNPLFFIDALNLLSAVPLTPSVQAIQRQRLLAFGDSNRYVLYDVADKNMFGHIDDMMNYWSAPEDDRELPGEINIVYQLAKYGTAESYLFTQYIMKIGRELKWSLTDFWDILKEHFVFMDQSAADMYWCKHERNKEYRWKQYSYNSIIDPFGFLNWLRLYQGTYPMLDDPRIIQRKHGSYINDILSEHLQTSNLDLEA